MESSKGMDSKGSKGAKTRKAGVQKSASKSMDSKGSKGDGSMGMKKEESLAWHQGPRDLRETH